MIQRAFRNNLKVEKINYLRRYMSTCKMHSFHTIKKRLRKKRICAIFAQVMERIFSTHQKEEPTSLKMNQWNWNQCDSVDHRPRVGAIQLTLWSKLRLKLHSDIDFTSNHQQRIHIKKFPFINNKNTQRRTVVACVNGIVRANSKGI